MAFVTGNKTLPGYPQQVGAKIEMVFDHTGPTSYTQFSAPATGGDVLNATTSGLGFGGFDFIDIGRDTTGQISATAVFTTGGTGNATKTVTIIYISQATTTLGGQSQTSGSQIATGTNLSTFSWRIRALCV